MARHLAVRRVPAHRFLLTLIVWLVAGAVAMAAADPLTVIPDDALGVAVINNLSDASARIQKLTEKMQLPVPELLPMAQLYTGAQQGLDENGVLAAAMFPSEDESASWSSRIAVFVPVTDYKAFVTQLQPDDATAEICEVTVFGQPFLATNKGGFAVLASSDAEPLLKRIRGTSQNVAATLKPLGPWLANQQIAVVLTPAGKTAALKAINGFLDIMAQAAEQAAAVAGDNAPAGLQSADSAGEAMSTIKELLGAAEPQVTQLGVGVRIDDSTALHASARLMFLPDGGLSRWAKDIQRPKEGLLAGLPPDKFAIAYGGAAMQFHPAFNKLIDRMTQLGMTVLGLDEESFKKLSKIMGQYRQDQIRTAMLMGQLRPGDSITATSMQIERVNNAEEHLKLMREMFTIMSKAQVPGAGGDKPLYTLKDVKVGDLDTLEVTTDMTAFMANAGGGQGGAAEAMQGFFGKLFGSGGVIHQYLAVVDDHTTIMAYSKEQLLHGVKHLRSGAPGLEADGEIAKTDKLLPEGAQWAAYLSPQGIVQWVDTIVKQLPAQLNLNIPPFPASGPIGIAAKVSADGLDAELVLPESVVEGIGQYVGVIQQMLQGGAPLP